MSNEIKIFVMDVDGTLTDGKIYIGNQGEAMKAFNVKDGYGIGKILPDREIEPIILTGRASKILEIRCKELGISEVYQNCPDKREQLLKIAELKGLTIKDGKIKGCAYIGDDVPDISCMEIAEISGCPADASQEVKKIANKVCLHNGGDGAVREFIEWIIENFELINSNEKERIS